MRALGRATLARQMLLAREPSSERAVTKAVERMLAVQSQWPKLPFFALWSRLEGFSRGKLAAAFERRALVRATWVRGTLHTTTAQDYLRFRATIDAMLRAGAATVLKNRSEGLDVARVVKDARAYFTKSPRTFGELRDHLVSLHPKVDERAMGYTARMGLPLVMVPEEKTWSFPADSRFALADAWLDADVPADGDAREDLVLRYLASHGPATVADAQTWTGLRGLKPLFESLRERLVTFRDEGGRELFDLPDAPRPDEDVDAPVRFLPEFDEAIVAHQERGRIVDDAHKSSLFASGLRVLASFLVDGRAAGTWSIARDKKRATLTLVPFGKVTKKARAELEEEGERLLRFAEEDAPAFEIVFGS